MRGSFALVLPFALLAWASAGSVVAQPKTDPKKASAAPAGADAVKVGSKTIDDCIKEFSLKDVSRREGAIRYVALFPPETAAKAIPALLAELTKPQPTDLSVRASVCVVLGELFRTNERIDQRLQVQAARILKRYLHDPQVVMRFRAAQTLGTIGFEAKEAIPDLLGMLKDQSSWEIRQAAAQALGLIAFDKQSGPNLEVLRALYAELGDPAFQVRLAAIQSLTYLGPPGDQAGSNAYVTALKQIEKTDSEVTMKIWARCAVAHAVQDFSTEMLSPIGKLMADPDPVVRTQSLQAMGTLGAKGRSTLPGIIACLRDSDNMVKMTAIWACGQMGDAAIFARDSLNLIAANPNESDQTKHLAKQALERINGK